MLIKNANSKTIAREAVVLDLGDLAAQGEVIKREAIASAQRTLREARTERARIVAGAEDEGRTRGLAEGKAKGLEEGRAAGRAEALAAETAALKALQIKWEKTLATFETQRDGLMIEARQSLLHLAASVARRVTKRHVEADRHVVAAQLEAALRMVLTPTKLVIEVDPAEIETAKRAVPGLMERLGGSENAEVRAREGLGAGSVIVRTDKGEIDASIRTQVDRAVAALMGDDDQPGPAPARLKGMADDDGPADAPPAGDSGGGAPPGGGS